MISPEPESTGGSSEQGVEAPHTQIVRLDAKMCIIESSGPGYREFFCVVTTAKTITVMAFDPSDEFSDGARLHHVPRPYSWNPGADAEEMLLQVWQAIGTQR